jgi:hypothetical protein
MAAWVLMRLHACMRQVPDAKGRILVSHGSTFSSKFMSDVLSQRFPQFKFPAGEDGPSSAMVDNSKASFPLGILLEVACILKSYQSWVLLGALAASTCAATRDHDLSCPVHCGSIMQRLLADRQGIGS